MNEKELKKEIYSLNIKNEGINLEYEYVRHIKDKKINELEEEINKLVEEKQILKLYYEKEFEDCIKEIEKYKEELEMIKNSKWWKLRNKLKGVK